MSKSPMFITAKFPGTCPETGKPWAKGETIAWFPGEKKAYHLTSSHADQVRALEFASAYGMADANW